MGEEFSRQVDQTVQAEGDAMTTLRKLLCRYIGIHSEVPLWTQRPELYWPKRGEAGEIVELPRGPTGAMACIICGRIR